MIYPAAKKRDSRKYFTANASLKQPEETHQLKDKIKAKYLATGDRVRFSRDGWQTVGQLTNCNAISVSFMFGDGIIRKLEAHKEYVVEKADQPPAPQPGQVMRLSKESNRVSVCATHSLLDLIDISESFRAIKPRGSFPNTTAAYYELERGSTLHTREAVYRMPLKWSGAPTVQRSF